MTIESRNPWDQQDGESNAAYARFLVYRNLGPTRSLRAAYATINPEPEEVAKSYKKPQASGQWQKDSVTFQWAERATAWDVAVLSTAGLETVVNFVNALNAMSRKTLEALAKDAIKPKDWRQVVDAINTLGGFIPAETVEQVQSVRASGGIPAVGTGPTSHD